MIVYKVVRDIRKSDIASGKYSLRYEDGKIVEKIKNTLGIFCFETLEEAINFATFSNDIVLKVEGIGRAKRKIKVISGSVSEKALDIFYADNSDYWVERPISGTVLYNAVKVIGVIKREGKSAKKETNND